MHSNILDFIYITEKKRENQKKEIFQWTTEDRGSPTQYNKTKQGTVKGPVDYKGDKSHFCHQKIAFKPPVLYKESGVRMSVQNFRFVRKKAAGIRWIWLLRLATYKFGKQNEY